LKFPHHTNEIAQAEAYHLRKDDEDTLGKEWIPTAHTDTCILTD
jgi:cysteinyl-tRNA synthetase